MNEHPELDVLHIQEQSGQRAPRHRLQPFVVAATCQTCRRLVLRWSLMSPSAARVVADQIRQAMAVARHRGSGPFMAFTIGNADHMMRVATMLECRAHGAHPHNGRTCLDCSVCRPQTS